MHAIGVDAVPDPTAVSQRKRREFLPIPLEATRMIPNRNRVPTAFEFAGDTQQGLAVTLPKSAKKRAKTKAFALICNYRLSWHVQLRSKWNKRLSFANIVAFNRRAVGSRTAAIVRIARPQGRTNPAGHAHS